MRAKIEVASTPGRARRLLWTAIVLVLLAASVESVIGRRVDGFRGQSGESGFALFATPRLVLAANRFQCTIANNGDECGFSELGPGGAFPTGTPDDYIYNSGFQVAGIASAEAGPWAGDTVGAYLIDTTGSQHHGSPLEQIYDSLNPDDLENWPEEAVIADPELFAPILIGRKTASQQDTWTRYWDGDPARNAQRAHPMGFAVTQRTMSWNYPSGNESVIYFLLAFENVTNDSDFQRLNELTFFGGGDALPDAGWAYDEVYVSVTADNDVAFANENYATAILPFDLGISYHGGFDVPAAFGWQFPPDQFFPPFFVGAPGIVGFKYLRSPLDPQTGEEVGLTMFSVYGFPASAFFDPQGGNQLWRYLSGRMDLGAGDPPCNVAAEIQTLSSATTLRSVCNIELGAKDIRFLQSSGPFTVAAGDASTVAVAYVIAPTVETMPDGSPSGIVANTANQNANPPGFPSFHPGFLSSRGCDTGGQNCTEILTAAENEVKTIERGAGWVSYDGPPPAGGIFPPGVEHPSNSIDESEVRVVPGSLLGRALVAQSVFDNKFLLGFPPEPPAFYLVPGDNIVTVLWEPSASETAGDPFYGVTSDPESALYNPNYRQFDVEGYRIWRGTQRGQLDLIAQFDYADTRFVDYTCETVPPDEDIGATDPDGEPVLGFAGGDTCPLDSADFLDRPINGSLIFNNGSAGGVPGAGVSREPVALALDTAIVSDRDIGQVEPLRDTGVPFAYVDAAVRSNFTYFYSVTAFDVNSQASGPLTLRSSMIDQTTIPRADAPNLRTPNFQKFLAGADGEPLVPEAFPPAIDPEAGTFEGPFPPSDATVSSFAPLIEKLLPQYHLTARIDSVVPVLSLGSSFGTPTAECSSGGDPFHTCLKLYLTVDLDGEQTFELVDIYSPWWGAFGEEPLPQIFNLVDAKVAFDPDALEAFGFPPTLSGQARTAAEFNEAINNSAAAGPQNRRFDLIHGGSRWFDEIEESTPDPARYIRVGHLDGVDTVWAPISYSPVDAGAPVSCFGGFGCSHFEKQCFERALAKLGRAADVRFTWAGGTLTEVRDITHGTDVPFAPRVRASWGFLTNDANGNGFVDWNDFNYLDPALEIIRDGVGGGECGGAGAGGFVPVGPSVDLVDTPSVVPTSTDGIADGQNFYDGLSQTGQGFGLYVNGERYIFELSALPADGTVWTLRSYNGFVETSEASFDTADPAGYLYGDDATGNGSGTRPVLVPGLTFHWLVEDGTTFSPVDLSEVHTVPDPYLSSSRLDLAPTTKQLMFVNLPPRATIRIYTVTGILVDMFNHDDATGGGRAQWDLRNRNNQFVASGVYFFHVVTPPGEEHVGKFTVINAVQ